MKTESHREMQQPLLLERVMSGIYGTLRTTYQTISETFSDYFTQPQSEQYAFALAGIPHAFQPYNNESEDPRLRYTFFMSREKKGRKGGGVMHHHAQTIPVHLKGKCAIARVEDKRKDETIVQFLKRTTGVSDKAARKAAKSYGHNNHK